VTSMNIINKIVLGTVQFGLDYGINNKNGKIKFAEVNSILNFAWENGIRLLDSAYRYGDSEEVNYVITKVKGRVI
jgi:uncharacterized protein